MLFGLVVFFGCSYLLRLKGWVQSNYHRLGSQTLHHRVAVVISAGSPCCEERSPQPLLLLLLLLLLLASLHHLTLQLGFTTGPQGNQRLPAGPLSNYPHFLAEARGLLGSRWAAIGRHEGEICSWLQYMRSAPAKSGAGLPRPRGAEYNERVPPRKLWLIPWGQAGRGTCAPCPAPSDLQVRPPLGVPPKFHPAASLGPLLLPQPICNSTLQCQTGVDQR